MQLALLDLKRLLGAAAADAASWVLCEVLPAADWVGWRASR